MSPSSSIPIFKPTLILHGGAGAIHRTTLPPSLYAQYHSSLLTYLRSARTLLSNGSSALDAAVHAVSLMEDNELFNCGRGSVFTSAGTIEMEASVMVTSVVGDDSNSEDTFKRGAGVIGLRNVRHPVQLAREVLLRTGEPRDGHRAARGEPLAEDDDDKDGHRRDNRDNDGGTMHSQLAAPYVEDLARAWGLEFKPDEWFFTQRRWDEHMRGLEGKEQRKRGKDDTDRDRPTTGLSMSQGTVGCVCLDQWGNLAVATSTGGLTNKVPGRVGDTPTLGAGFWAESWEVEEMDNASKDDDDDDGDSACGRSTRSLWDLTLRDCLPGFLGSMFSHYVPLSGRGVLEKQDRDVLDRLGTRKRAMALSGTGNGDSFLRTAAARTACAMARFSAQNAHSSAAAAVTAVAGPGGELQRSAGRRWGKTGEGEGGIIGIEVEFNGPQVSHSRIPRLARGKVVFDFNCGGMWRAWIEEGIDGSEIERVMVFRDEYH